MDALMGRPLEGKDDRLGVLSEAPCVLETPQSLLLEHDLTPISRLFVRNVRDLAEAMTLEPLPLAGWELELSGLIDTPLTVRAEELLDLEQTDVEMVLQCSGNSRSRFSEIAPTAGTPWGGGALANVRFGGVRLSRLLESRGVTIARARFLTAEAKSDRHETGRPGFEHSLPLEDALERSILALRLNGQPLPGVHGGPIRLVTPGYYGTMHVKWLRRLRFERDETAHYYHATEYRVPNTILEPGQPFEFTFENSTPTWKLRLNSFILGPQPEAELNAGAATIGGVAFNDGTVRVEKVLVSIDRGRTWRSAVLNVPASPYAWYRWAIHIDLEPGSHQLWCRAVDELGRTQPLDGKLDWNPNGYQWNAVHKIDITVV